VNTTHHTSPGNNHPAIDSLISLIKVWDERANTDQDASIVIPVNAQEHLQDIFYILSDIGDYRGAYSFEIILVINNYPPQNPPPEIRFFKSRGIRVVPVSDVRIPGQHPALTSRILGIEAAHTDSILLFDADCRLPYPTPLLDWYIRVLHHGAHLAYTHVAYINLLPDLSIRIRIGLHHILRWIKRVLLRIPTSRGSNYAVRRTSMLDLDRQGLISGDIFVGPAMKSAGARIIYSGHKQHTVLTSGNKIKRGWKRAIKYWWSRIRINALIFRLLPAKKDKS